MLINKEDLFKVDYEDKRPNWITYNGNIDDDILDRLKSFNVETYDKIIPMNKYAKLKGWSENYVELIQHILSEYDLVEYGSSPRFPWITELGKKYLKFRSESEE